MQALHGSWIVASGSIPPRFAIWAEVTRASLRRAAGRRSERLQRHPFSATAEELRETLVELEAAGDLEALIEASVVACLPSAGGAPLPSPSLRSDSGYPRSDGIELAPWQTPALVLDAGAATRALMALAPVSDRQGIILADDLRFWTAATRLALELLTRERFLPAIEAEQGGYAARWRPLLHDGVDGARIAALAASMPPACRTLAWNTETLAPDPRALLHGFLNAAVDTAARDALAAAAPAHKPKSDRRRQTAAQCWTAALAGDPVLAGETAAVAQFSEKLGAWLDPASGGREPPDTFRICFRLEPPLDGPAAGIAGAPGRHANWTLHFLLQATDDPSLLVPAAEVWRRKASAARFLHRRFDNPQERLLAGLGRASRLVPAIEDILRIATPVQCSLTLEEAHTFVREHALLLQESGFGVLVPTLATKVGLRLALGASRGSSAGSTPGVFTWDSLVNYDWQLAIGDQTLSRAEFEALSRLKQPLVQIREQWVELHADQISRALAFFQSRGEGQMPLPDAIRLALSPNGDLGLPVAEVATAGWIDELLQALRGDAKPEEMNEPPGFRGRLRPYQKTGFSWLAGLSRYGVGACLADDMGLGKTVQMIALLLHQRAMPLNGAAQPSLLICPTSVVGNWLHELNRFAPDLKVLVHHGSGRTKEGFAGEAQGHDIVISTYALLHRDEVELTAVEWSNVILDEAQNIKNPSARATQAAGHLHARWRAALTGTPIENNLSDLWSLFNFLDPGYLGRHEEFRRRFAQPIERAGDTGRGERLKSIVSPLILRRLKSDKAIIEDLPEKNEMSVFCNLSREQVTLYEAIVKDSVQQIEAAEGIGRRGLILATLAKLKQVCDHPALFLKDGSALGGRSGKLTRLTEMLEEAATIGDRALIFTQYAAMGTLLKQHLEAAFGQEVLYLHGGTPAAQRDRMVARFQAEHGGPQFFILSIKAGGTGLNLTRANQVFHFDRWWNPAVENQATDRAFRIGQRRDVQVHKFICGGTLEESIDELIERKVALSESIVGRSEAWITELSADQLRELFRLRPDAVGAE
jgi:SNF2 family DNA or RNA helicase